MGDVMVAINRVKTVTSFGRSGVSDWLVQRVSAVILLAYIVFLLSAVSCGLEYDQWKNLFSRTSVQVFSTMALFATVAHAWIGAWSVLTDYVTDRFFKLELGIDFCGKAAVLRLVLEIFTILLMAAYALWGIKILWGM
jgi:succinate dehydrogenase / fumarate reductase membrane anchor subunit